MNRAWKNIKPSKPADDIPVSAEVVTWEEGYSMPTLTGTPRQVAWARLIRHQLMVEVFAGLMAATQGHENPTTVYAAVDTLRGERIAATWIEVHRPHLGVAVAHLLLLAST